MWLETKVVDGWEFIGQRPNGRGNGEETGMKPIPQEWILEFVDELVKAAESFGDTAMGNAVAERAEHIMDMVKSFRESEARKGQPI